MNRHDIMEAMFANPIMLDDLDFLYKNDMARKVLFFFQPKGDEVEVEEEDRSTKKDPRARKNQGLAVLAEKDKEADEDIVKTIFTTDGMAAALTGLCMYFIRLTTKRALGEETFQREIITGVISAVNSENVLWYLERIVSTIFIPLLNTNLANDKTNELLRYKVRKELLPCLRSFTSCLRVAETVWSEGLLIEHFPPESHTIKNLDDSWALLATPDGLRRFEEAVKILAPRSIILNLHKTRELDSTILTALETTFFRTSPEFLKSPPRCFDTILMEVQVRIWMKSIYELLLESEQLRLETDDAGPQVGVVVAKPDQMFRTSSNTGRAGRPD